METWILGVLLYLLCFSESFVMKLIYLTSKKYPSKTADHFFIKEMANRFGDILKENFSLVLANNFSDHFKKIKVINLGLKRESGRTFYYFFWLLFFVAKARLNGSQISFFSNDPNLLCNLIMLRKIFGFKYKICSEWHILYDDWRDSFIVRNSDFVVATSNLLMRMIAKKANVKIDKEKFLVVYGGVNLEKYPERDIWELRKELDLPEDKILAAYVGLFKTLGVKKSIDVMINALAYLPENVNMVFVGGKKEEIAEYSEQIPDKKLLNRCIFIEKQETDRVPLYQKAVDILVIPNPDKYPFNDYCIPMKIYEYLASRKPIIYSNLALLSEVLADCGFSFTPDDPKDLARAILFTLNSDSEIINKKIQVCLDRASRYSWENRAETILNFLKIKY